MSKVKDAGISWVIVGQCTPVRKSTAPELLWIKDIVEAADMVGIPVFLKNNLYSLFELEDIPNGYIGYLKRHHDVPKWAHADHGINILRQEFPNA